MHLDEPLIDEDTRRTTNTSIDLGRIIRQIDTIDDERNREGIAFESQVAVFVGEFFLGAVQMSGSTRTRG